MGTSRRPVQCDGPPQPSPPADSPGTVASSSEATDQPQREGPARYIPYIARIKMLLLKGKLAIVKGSRYIAYSSDVGESLRPVLSPTLVNLTYGIAGAYIVGDTGLRAYRKYND